jgi:hypothetical protein
MFVIFAVDEHRRCFAVGLRLSLWVRSIERTCDDYHRLIIIGFSLLIFGFR